MATFASLQPRDHDPRPPGYTGRPKMPWISAIVSSACLLFGWGLILIMYLYKYIQKAAARARRGKALRDAEEAEAAANAANGGKKPVTFIIPPDPAVITGMREPGEQAFRTGTPVRSASMGRIFHHHKVDATAMEVLHAHKGRENGKGGGSEGASEYAQAPPLPIAHSEPDLPSSAIAF
ncbi:hypothetical protein EVG20_g9893 [Dentipellis fragilis]|uniref:Uncharacterized protein n=1 Tax=Dentipellis fragilis TaxID=205917 RepID=A0A4Y9XZE6_9AGAM|nr:hypothetical protein EVG20_g9893 [Dentipellis fragilis]